MGSITHNKISPCSARSIEKVSGAQEEEFEGKDKKMEPKHGEVEARFKLAENLVVVVTLIATASFAAGITVPGGLHSDDDSKQAGIPFLLSKAAFQVFAVANAVAFSLSCGILNTYVTIVLPSRNYCDTELHLTKQERIDNLLVEMYTNTGYALWAMEVAFISGVYVVSMPSRALAIIICVLTSFIIAIKCGIYITPSALADILDKQAKKCDQARVTLDHYES